MYKDLKKKKKTLCDSKQKRITYNTYQYLNEYLTKSLDILKIFCSCRKVGFRVHKTARSLKHLTTGRYLLLLTLEITYTIEYLFKILPNHLYLISIPTQIEKILTGLVIGKIP